MRLFFLLGGIFVFSFTMAQTVYEIDAVVPSQRIYSGHLKLGGSNPKYEFSAATKVISDRKIAVSLPQSLPLGINDIRLDIDYTGDTGMGFLNGELVADNFYNGLTWQIGLRKFMSPVVKPKEMVLYFRPMEKNASYLLDLQAFLQYIPDFGKSRSYLKVNKISFNPQYKTTIQF